MGNAKQEVEGEGNTSSNTHVESLVASTESLFCNINDSRGYDEVVKDCLSMWVSLLDNREKYYEGCKNESVLKDHVQSLKKGLEFLCKLYNFSTNRNLARSSRQLVTKVKCHSLSVYLEENEDLRRIMMNLVNIIKKIGESSYIFNTRDLSHNYRSIIDLLLEYISDVKSTWYNNRNASSDDQTAALEKKVGELRMTLTYYKPLYICLANPSHLYHPLMNSNLDSVINKAAVVIYLLFVGKMHKQTVKKKLNMIMRYVENNCREFNIYVRFLKFSNEQDFSSNVKGQFYILDNLIHMLAVNSDSLNDANNHLYEELKELRTFVANIRGSKRLNHYLGLTAATESICYQAEPIVSSCYMEAVELEEVMSGKLNDILISVIGQIKMIKRHHGSQEIKPYDYPKVDFSAFLEYFLRYLKELRTHEQISIMWSEIDSLHTDFCCLMSSPKTSQEKLSSGRRCTDILRLAYQAEYVMDMYLVTPDSSCISTLSNIVADVKEIKEKLLALPDRSLPVEDVFVSTSSHVHSMPQQLNNVLVGFSQEIDSVRNFLSGENDLQTISIVGMPGAGKTSLAKHVFNESSVDVHFDRKAWCTASQSYQRKDLLLTILKQINPVESDVNKMDDQELADKLCRSLKRRRYIVVIDDVWDVSLWNYLSRYFPNDKNKSRILITTRDHNVASEITSKIHKLRALTEESWKLLQKKLHQEESLPENLVSIAEEVAKSCKGLPLSIIIIGSLMQNAERNEETWNQIAKDATSNILNDPQGNCKDILELSYNHLPNQLKSCLLYIGVFPEDHEISVSHLVRLWISEGLLQGGITSDESVEDVGKRYVDALINRSLVIPIKMKTEGGVKSFQLHDLLREFCLKKAKEGHFFTVHDDRGIFDLSICPRRILINRDMDMHLPFISLNSVRTIISFVEGEITRMLDFQHMMLLNVLDIHAHTDPSSFLDHFVHLRYLALWEIDCSHTILLQLSFSKLMNLQVLILSLPNLVTNVIEVPDFILDLVKLRHIQLLPRALFPRHDSKRLQDSPVLLENLMSLSKPCLHYGDSNWLSKLPELQKLSCIFFYSSGDILLQQYRFPQLDLCKQLTSLKVENGAQRNEIGKLHLPKRLMKLSLRKFKLDSDDISEIGKSLPNLEVLKLHDSVENWSANDEDFPRLKVLKITGGNWYKWDASEDSFPSLEQLWLQSCVSLKRIPLSFGDIPCLRLISIKYCNRSVSESAREIEKIQAEAQNLELKVNLS